jgi:hypothetical protein
MRLSPTRRRRIDAVGWDVALQVEEGGDLGQGVLGVGDQVLVLDHQQGWRRGASCSKRRWAVLGTVSR